MRYIGIEYFIKMNQTASMFVLISACVACIGV